MVKGLDRLEKRWGAIPQAVKNAARQTLQQNAEELVALMKSLVPIDEGELRDSIGWTFGAAPVGATGLVGSRAGSIRVTIYAKGPGKGYARYVEFGTQSPERGGGAPAQPFFYPAYRALRRRHRSRLTRNINKAIRKAATA